VGPLRYVEEGGPSSGMVARLDPQPRWQRPALPLHNRTWCSPAIIKFTVTWNKVFLIGNLGKDPEVRTTQAGAKIVTLTLATGESWTDKATGERKERTEWHRVVVFNERLADVAEQFLRKGRKVCVEGALQTRKWTDQAGVERYSTEVVLQQFRGELTLLDSNRDAAEGEGTPARERTPARPRDPAAAGAGGGWGPGGGELDDDIPFACCWQ